MDETPNYLCRSATAPRLLKEVYEKIGANVSALRFIVVLREPVARAISHFKHNANMRARNNIQTHIRPWNLTCDKYFEYVLDPPKHTDFSGCEPLNAGRYHLQLKDWFRHFDPSQFMVLTLDQPLKDIDRVLKAIVSHAGGTTKKLTPRKVLVRANSASAYELPHHDKCQVMPELKEFYKPHNRELKKLKDHYPYVFFNMKENPFITFE